MGGIGIGVSTCILLSVKELTESERLAFQARKARPGARTHVRPDGVESLDGEDPGRPETRSPAGSDIAIPLSEGAARGGGSRVDPGGLHGPDSGRRAGGGRDPAGGGSVPGAGSGDQGGPPGDAAQGVDGEEAPGAPPQLLVDSISAGDDPTVELLPERTTVGRRWRYHICGGVSGPL